MLLYPYIHVYNQKLGYGASITLTKISTFVTGTPLPSIALQIVLETNAGNGGYVTSSPVILKHQLFNAKLRTPKGHIFWGYSLTRPEKKLQLPSGYVKIAIENDPVEIMDFPMKNGGSFHSYVKLPEGSCNFSSAPD